MSGTRAAASGGDPLTGRVIAAKYELGEVLGTGSMGKVYRATHTGLGRTVAVKILHGSYQNEARMVARFHREAQAASLIHHPNVVEIIDFGQEQDGTLYIVMEFLEGTNLRLLIEEQGLTQSRATYLMAQILSAVAAAHAKGIVHRDLKPENVVVVSKEGDDGQQLEVVKILDFGIAKIKSRGAAGGVMAQTVEMATGTPEFMSPEQCSGKPLDERSDVYSCGCLLYVLLTGRVPFTSESAVGTVLKQVNEAPIPPSQCNPKLSSHFDAIVLRALEKKPDDRYQEIRQMRGDLLQLADRLQLGPIPHSGPLPTLRSSDTEGDASGVVSSERDTRPDGRKKGGSRPLDVPSAKSRSGSRIMLLAGAMFLSAAGVGIYGLVKKTRSAALVAPGEVVAVASTPAAMNEVPERFPPPVEREIAVEQRPIAPPDDVVPPDGIAPPISPNELEDMVAIPPAPLRTKGEEAPAFRPAPKAKPPKRGWTPKRPAIKKQKKKRSARTASRRPTAKAKKVEASPAVATQRQDTRKTSPQALVAVPAPPPSAAPSGATPQPPPAGQAMPPAAAPSQPPPAPRPAAPPVLDATTQIARWQVQGPLPSSVLRRAVQRLEGDIDRCYTSAARRVGKDGFGEVRVAFRITTTGRASAVETSGGGLPGLDRCVRGVIARVVSRRKPDLGEARAAFVVQFRKPR
ncbi:MAG: protein kinase [Proteobacteria bacterium]|nr:protein kinase [Pseudomonadota bacterium]